MTLPSKEFMKRALGTYKARIAKWFGIAESTRKGYAAAVGAYERYLEGEGVPHGRKDIGWYPASVYNLEGWAASYMGKAQGKTAGKYMAGLQSMHDDYGIDTLAFGGKGLKRILVGIDRLGSIPKAKQAPALTLPLLEAMLPQLDLLNSPSDAINLKTVAILAFSCFLWGGD